MGDNATMSMEQVIDDRGDGHDLAEVTTDEDGVVLVACQCGEIYGPTADERSARALWAGHREAPGEG